MTLAQAEEVFALLGAQWPAGSVMRYFARNKAGITRGDTILDPSTLANMTEWATNHGWNCYVQMNPTDKKGIGRVSAADVSHWSWFLVDLDPVPSYKLMCSACHYAWKNSLGMHVGPCPACGEFSIVSVVAITPQLDLAREFVEGFMSNYLGMQHLKYTLIDSGRGWQMWFPIAITELKWKGGPADTQILVRTEPLARDFELTDPEYHLNTERLTLREASSRSMSYWLNLLKERMEQVLPDCGVTIDTSVSDLPRVMRLPYTWNFKSNRPTSILRKAEGWNPALGEKLISYTPYNVWRKVEYDAYEMAENATWHHYLTHPGMKVNARIYLTEGAHEGGRHKAATAALLSLKELGCNGTQAEAALLWGARLCSPPLESREITPMIDRHFQRRKA